MTQNKKFHGKLAKPIAPRILGLLMNDDEINEKLKEWEREDFENLLLLCDHYGIKESNPMFAFANLSIALAKDLRVPAFTESKKRGRREKWDEFTRGILVAEVERTIKPGNDYGVSWATKELAKKEPWKSFIKEKGGSLDSDPSEVLRQIYYNSVNIKFAKVARKACMYYVEIEKSVQDWENFIKESVGKF